MEYLIGLGVAVAVCVFAKVTGFDRDRSFYPTVTVVVAHYYLLFAAIAGSARALLGESVIALLFIALAVAGFKKSLWLVVAALVGHGLMDSVHSLLVANPGVPAGWPGFCLSFDVLAGGLLALLLKRHADLTIPVSVEAAAQSGSGENSTGAL